MKATAVLCRTNGPLIAMVFDLKKMADQHRKKLKFKVLGRDLATRYKNVIGDVLINDRLVPDRRSGAPVLGVPFRIYPSDEE